MIGLQQNFSFQVMIGIQFLILNYYVYFIGIGECKEDFLEIGDWLVEFVEEFNILFVFYVVIDRFEDV